MSDIVGVILAGGQATRMGGGDKALLRVGDARLIDHVIARLVPQVCRIGLNANGDPGRFADLGLPVLPDSVAGFPGPLAGVLAGLDWAAGIGADHVITVAADTPFFPVDLVARLQDAARQAGTDLALAGVRAANGKIFRQPTFGLWPVALRDDLRAALSDGIRKVVIWTEKHDAATALFPDEAAFFNVNTPDDLAALRAERGAKQP